MRNIVNCDIDVKLRMVGQEKHSMHITSDEGDGYSFSKCHTSDDLKYHTEAKPHHYEEWADQLEDVAKRLREIANEPSN